MLAVRKQTQVLITTQIVIQLIIPTAMSMILVGLIMKIYKMPQVLILTKMIQNGLLL